MRMKINIKQRMVRLLLATAIGMAIALLECEHAILMSWMTSQTRWLLTAGTERESGRVRPSLNTGEMDLRSSFHSLFGLLFSKKKRVRKYHTDVVCDEADQKVDLVVEDDFYASCLFRTIKNNLEQKQVCLYHLGKFSKDNVAVLVDAANSLKDISQQNPLIVLNSICTYLQLMKQISPKHRLRINEILPAMIRSAHHIDSSLATILIKEALDDLMNTTDLQGLYEDAAADILVALWGRFPTQLFTNLLQSFQGQLLSHHGALKLLTKLADKGLKQRNSSKREEWERKLVELGARTVLHLSDKTCCKILYEEFMAEERTSEENILAKLFLYQCYGAILRACNDSGFVEDSLCNLLKLSQTRPCERAGIAFAVGLCASRHSESIFRVLEDFLEKCLAEETTMGEACQYNVRNTLLQCYGHIIVRLNEDILPRTEQVMSQIIRLQKTNPMEMTLKKRFLLAIMPLLKMLAAGKKAQKKKADPTGTGGKWPLEINTLAQLSAILTSLCKELEPTIHSNAAKAEQLLSRFLKDLKHKRGNLWLLQQSHVQFW